MSGWMELERVCTGAKCAGRRLGCIKMAEINLYEMSAQARERDAASKGIRAEGYTGKNRYQVLHGNNKAVTVFAGDMIAALYTAAEHWQMDPRKAEFHQSCRVKRC